MQLNDDTILPPCAPALAVLAIFAFQRYFVEGIRIGGVKG